MLSSLDDGDDNDDDDDGRFFHFLKYPQISGSLPQCPSAVRKRVGGGMALARVKSGILISFSLRLCIVFLGRIFIYFFISPSSSAPITTAAGAWANEKLDNIYTLLGFPRAFFAILF